jgi:hypothetical protein
VLRRDNHTCRYCGATAPDVKLTVDHVIPQALGGTDDPGNLVTACVDCNAGKSSSNPDAPLVDEVSDAALRWGRAVEAAAGGMLRQLEAVAAVRREFLDAWNEYSYGPSDDRRPVPLGANWRQSIDLFMARGLPIEVIKECVPIAMAANKIAPDNVFRYFCGVAWRKVNELTEAAKQLYDGAGSEAKQPEPAHADTDLSTLVFTVEMAVHDLGAMAGKDFLAEALETARSHGIPDMPRHEVADFALVQAVQHLRSKEAGDGA